MQSWKRAAEAKASEAPRVQNEANDAARESKRAYQKESKRSGHANRQMAKEEGRESQKLFAVPMQAMQVSKEHSNAFILNETKESLKNYPVLIRNTGQRQTKMVLIHLAKNNGGFMRWQSNMNYGNP